MIEKHIVLEDVDPVVKENVNFVPVQDITEVLETAVVGFTKNVHKSKKSSVTDRYSNVVRQ